VAQIHREKLANAKRAIEVYREILRTDPQDAVSTRALVDIYEHAGDFAGLAGALREQIETAPTLQERVTLLRKVLALYDEKLADLAQGEWAATQILEAVPGDRDTLGRLEGILERAGDARKLVVVLDQHARHAGSADEKVQLVARIAELHQGPLQDPAGAALRWEEIVRLDPDDARALEALEGLYTALGKPAKLGKKTPGPTAQFQGSLREPFNRLRYLEPPTDDRFGSKAEELTVSKSFPLRPLEADLVRRGWHFSCGPIPLIKSVTDRSTNTPLDRRHGRSSC